MANALVDIQLSFSNSFPALQAGDLTPLSNELPLLVAVYSIFVPLLSSLLAGINCVLCKAVDLATLAAWVIFVIPGQNIHLYCIRYNWLYVRVWLYFDPGRHNNSSLPAYVPPRFQRTKTSLKPHILGFSDHNGNLFQEGEWYHKWWQSRFRVIFDARTLLVSFARQRAQRPAMVTQGDYTSRTRIAHPGAF